MLTVAIFHTNDTWDKHRLLWSGYYALKDKTYLFGDSYSVYIAGRHASLISGYGTFGGMKQLTRLTYSDTLAIAGHPSGGMDCYPDGPVVATFGGGKITHYLNEWGEALGTAYTEILLTSGTASEIHYHEGYPEVEDGWDLDVSGVDFGINDVIGLDYPDEPRIIVSTLEMTPPSAGIVVIDVHVVSGYAQGQKTDSDISLLPSGILITDLEAHEVL